MNPIAIDFGFFQIYWYSVFILLALFLGLILIVREGKKHNILPDFIINMFFWGIPISIAGARLYYVLFNWSYYSGHMFDILKVWEGGLAIHGGLIAGVIWIIYYSRKYNVNTMRVLDMTAISMLLGQAIGRWGNFFNQEAHGFEVSKQTLQHLHIPSFIIDGMRIYGVYYHPTFFYESLWNIAGFLFLIIYRQYRYLKIGELAGLYLIWYSTGRFAIEFLRTDSLMLYNFKVAQLISILLFTVGVVILIVVKRKARFNNLYHDEDDENE